MELLRWRSSAEFGSATRMKIFSSSLSKERVSQSYCPAKLVRPTAPFVAPWRDWHNTWSKWINWGKWINWHNAHEWTNNTTATTTSTRERSATATSWTNWSNWKDTITTKDTTTTMTETAVSNRTTTITDYIRSTVTYMPEDVRVFTKYVYVFILALVFAPMAVWRLMQGGKQPSKTAASPKSPLRLCLKCGRDLSEFPSGIRVCPYCQAGLV